jgi:hypothetical protein
MTQSGHQPNVILHMLFFSFLVISVPGQRITGGF